MAQRRCDNCKFWHRLTDDFGDCHRNAPVVTSNKPKDSRLFAMWPETDSDDWCGEFLPVVRSQVDVENLVPIRRYAPSYKGPRGGGTAALPEEGS